MNNIIMYMYVNLCTCFYVFADFWSCTCMLIYTIIIPYIENVDQLKNLEIIKEITHLQ